MASATSGGSAGASTTGSAGASAPSGGSSSSGGASVASTSGNGSGGASGGATSGGATSGAGGVQLDVSPPLPAVEGVWQVFRQSPMGTCGVEPTEWSNNGIFFALIWDGKQLLNEYSCSSASIVDCSSNPSAYGRFRVTDGQWVAVRQNATDSNTCIWEEQRLQLLDGAVLRLIYGTRTVLQGCGPNQQDLAACSNGWIQEARRAN
ncbi:MAG TPA: hypothetical protein VJV79_16555 [Polyangiaceae bacterium]|nr:hypothetical protein [Polyangiaceae bacterium]